MCHKLHRRILCCSLLKLRKVAAHVSKTLGMGVLSVAGGAPLELELWCGEKRCPRTMNLLTVRQFLWKQGGDMHLMYAPSTAANGEPWEP